MSKESSESSGAVAETKVDAGPSSVDARTKKKKKPVNQRVPGESFRRLQKAVDDARRIQGTFNNLSLTEFPAAPKTGDEEGGSSELAKDPGSENAKAEASGSKTGLLLEGSRWAKFAHEAQACFRNKYGTPRVPSKLAAAPSPSLALPAPPEDVLPIAFKSWPKRVERSQSRIAKRRTIILTGLPEKATLEDVSTICKGTGTIEEITFSPATKGMVAVTFVVAQVAERFYKNTANGVELTLSGDDKRHLISVELDREALVLSSLTHSRISFGATRVIRIVGWRRNEVLEFLRLKNALPPLDASFKTIVWKVATAVCLGNQSTIESAKWEKNHLGFLVMILTFSNINTASMAQSILRREATFEGCNIQFGVDPCAL